jgi:hypothetical protein
MTNPANEIFDSYLAIENPAELEKELSKLPANPGLILFADSCDNPIQLLTAANIKRAAKSRLFGPAKQGRRADLKSITAKIYYKTCPCKFRLAIEHYKAVKKTFPSNYKDHITFVQPWFIKTDLSEKTPFFSITKKPFFKKEEKISGPFPSQKAATVFLNTLEDTFKLCKRSDLVNNPAQAASCPYLQMDACSGVCAGKINCEDYQVIIKDAFKAGANPAKTTSKLQSDMQTASEKLNFEKAAELKRKIEKLSVLKKQTYRWTGDLEKLKIVHIDKAGKIKQEGVKAKKQTFAVFVMNFFEIIDCRKASPSGLGDFMIDDFAKITGAIENALSKLNSGRQDIGNSIEILEQFSIISYFLYRTKPSGLWLNVSEGFDKTVLKRTISEKFKL